MRALWVVVLLGGCGGGGDGAGPGDAAPAGDAAAPGDAAHHEDARVAGDAALLEDARVAGDAALLEDARVAGDAALLEDARVASDAAPREDAGAVDAAPREDAAAPAALPASDAFEGAALDPSWTVFNPDTVRAEVGGGALDLTLLRFALWFNAGRGALVHKPVTGDFRVTTTVRVRRATDPGAPPVTRIHLAGLMARSPASDAPGGLENYVFIVTGFDENDLSVETKTTTDGRSVYQGPPWPSGDAELRLCRVGATFRLYKRAIGDAAWIDAATFERPDLPATLQVGPNIYSAAPMPDLLARFDEVRFEPVAGEADCTR